MNFLTDKSFIRSAAAFLLVLSLTACGNGSKIDPAQRVEISRDFSATHTAEVMAVTQPVWYEAVGTVAPANTVNIAPQVNGRILEVLVDVGQKIQAGATLLRIDDRAIQARVGQAQSAVVAATAGAEQASEARKRVERLFEREAATPEQIEAVTAADLQAQAALQQAAQALIEAKTNLGFTQIDSPVDGVVAQRWVDAGDLALPGQPVLQIHGGDFDFVAAIRESEVTRLQEGSKVDVFFPAIELRLPATVYELSPAGDPNTRSVTIKANLPASELLRAGMYGKLIVQVDELQVIAVPAPAISRVGQLETVMVKTAHGWQRRFVRSGTQLDDGSLEILSGLSVGEMIGWSQ